MNAATMINAAAALFAASTLCADVRAQAYYDYAPRMAPPRPQPGAGADVVSSFVCYMSFDDFGNYQTVSDHQVCNGVAECPEGEDEAGCGSLEQEARGMMMPPRGFVRLPDNLQQKEYNYGFGAQSVEEGKAISSARLTNTDPSIASTLES